MISREEIGRVNAATKLNRSSGGLRPRHLSRHLTKEEEIAEVYKIGVLSPNYVFSQEAEELGLFIFRENTPDWCFELRTKPLQRD